MNLPAVYADLAPYEKRTVRAAYIVKQKGKCAHCGAFLFGPPREDVKAKRINMKLFPENFMRWPIHLHHDHNTGLTIGAVHAHCNAVLWQYHGE